VFLISGAALGVLVAASLVSALTQERNVNKNDADCMKLDPNSMFVNSTANPRCQENCETGEPKYCTYERFDGCVCKDGMVEDKEKDGKCIPKEECPPMNPDGPDEGKTKECQKKDPNSMHDECTGHCVPSCDDYETKVCPYVCEPGCVCKDWNHVLDKEGGKCIHKDQCPNKPAMTTEKPAASQEEMDKACQMNDPNTMHSPCGGHCRPTCYDFKMKGCTLECSPGCVCKDKEMVLDKKGGKCITKDQCPKRGTRKPKPK
jgi:hypothetical protein